MLEFLEESAMGEHTLEEIVEKLKKFINEDLPKYFDECKKLDIIFD